MLSMTFPVTLTCLVQPILSRSIDNPSWRFHYLTPLPREFPENQFADLSHFSAFVSENEANRPVLIDF